MIELRYEENWPLSHAVEGHRLSRLAHDESTRTSEVGTPSTSNDFDLGRTRHEISAPSD
jgi:hypothetical protein